MQHDYKPYLVDILDRVDKIERYLEGLSFDDLDGDAMRVDAVLYNLLIISEAAGALPDSLKQDETAGWSKLANLRDTVTSQHPATDLNNAWDIIQNNLADLRHSVLQILDEDA